MNLLDRKSQYTEVLLHAGHTATTHAGTSGWIC